MGAKLGALDRLLGGFIIAQGQVFTIKSGLKVYQQYLIHDQVALIRRQPFEETSFMVGKYITKLPWLKVFPYN